MGECYLAGLELAMVMGSRIILVLTLLLCGCNSDLTAKEKIEVWKEASEFMKEHRMAGTVSLTIRGEGEAYVKNAVGVDTGISVVAAAQFNSTQGSSNDEVPTKNAENVGVSGNEEDTE